ncbi:MAG: DNA topoisomerase III [Desulfobacter sp.]|nr:MAG: DNA topoisomerase III [Desulfobacter sp.]
MTDLILTEKFSVAADFAKALGASKKGNGFFEGNGVTVTWAVGHLVELYEPEDYDPALKKWRLESLPLIPERFQYKPVKKTFSRFRVIRDLLRKKKFGRVVLATDAGREGEVIARTILLESGFKDRSRVYRFWTSQALVPDVVRRTMEKVRPMADYDRLWRAGYYRQVSDWLIGMNCTRVLTIRLKDLFSVGRVQTAVLALLVDRKKERDHFVPQPYWVMTAEFSNEKGAWTGRRFKGKENRIIDREQAEQLYERLNRQGISGSVKSLDRENKREAPPFLFSLTDLQQEANKRFGFPAGKTLDLAQKLYQDRKCLSYPRTDARVLGSQNLDMVQEIIKKLAPVSAGLFEHMDPARLSLANKRVFNDAKLTDHHALIPLKPVPAGAGAEEKRIYDLVLRRFAAAFHPDCRFEVTRLVTLVDNETFATRGKIILEPGWQRVWKPLAGKKEAVDLIPPLVPGDPAGLDRIKLEEKQTRPPAEYTDASLLKDMTNPGRYVEGEAEKKLFRGEVGIGTQSTRAQIIETLIKRQYISRAGKQLLALDKGVFLVEALRKCPVSSRLTSPEETARWEMGLNRIALGEEEDARFLEGIKIFTEQSVTELAGFSFDTASYTPERTAPGLSGQASVPLGKCPGCGKDVTERYKAYSCGDRACGFVIWKRIAGKSISPKMAANLIRYRRSGPFKGFISKKKKRFTASLAIVQEDGKLRVAFEFEPRQEAAPANDAAPVCPVCGGAIIEGKKGYGCSNWRPEQGDCRFVIWKTISGKKLTLANAHTLAAGKTTRPYVFRTGGGEKFKARLRMVEDSGAGFCIALLPESGDRGLWEPGLVPCTRPAG